jgi:hypothetical protein
MRTQRLLAHSGQLDNDKGASNANLLKAGYPTLLGYYEKLHPRL